MLETSSNIRDHCTVGLGIPVHLEQKLLFIGQTCKIVNGLVLDDNYLI